MDGRADVTALDDEGRGGDGEGAGPRPHLAAPAVVLALLRGGLGHEALGGLGEEEASGAAEGVNHVLHLNTEKGLLKY